ncbi:hypothetical protein GALMADRAFT_116836 [Galerina marginata CBS 339.88]|uniref:Ubiquitin-like domain-containing protein n=1 Tax=Galerina marginata (strain CBS 339.88) TaxID=685588 RepID=A0A067TML4_GALM3|nr:hypothetical protein GALMADRAFT_116836 [Galerina marginata CBS 339.88]
MAEQAEKAFARAFLNTLSTQPIVYGDDYQQPPEHSLRRVPVLPIPIPPLPARKPQPEASGSSSASISLTFKSSKPPASFTLAVHPTDTVASIKAQLASQPSAPPADVQRLLLKGKALADAKLLKEYNIKEGDTINLMLKPGYDWNPTATPPQTSAPMATVAAPVPKPFGSGKLDANPPARGGEKKHGKHQRIPSVVLSPSPSDNSPGLEKDIVLTIDTGALPSPVGQPETLSTYHQTVANPVFWEKLFAFIEKEFTTEGDIHLAFEDFLCAAKGSLTASEIAKIRDHVGVVGMAGT